MSEEPTYADLQCRVKELKDTVRKYQAIVENSPDLLYQTDLQGQIVYISPSVYRLSGYTAEEAIGMNMAEEVYLKPEERNILLAKLQENGSVTNFEARLKRKDGSIWWASTNAHYIKDLEEDSKFVTNDVVHDPRVHDNEWARKLGLKSFAGYRLLSELGKPIGVLALFSKKAISSDISALLEGLANNTSQVIQTSLKEEALIKERDKLQDAIAQIKKLSGMLPICSSCKKIRDDNGYWNQIESYIRHHSEAQFSHGICPECVKKLYPDIQIYND
jgi:PAS domain S-box-containing protein